MFIRCRIFSENPRQQIEKMFRTVTRFCTFYSKKIIFLMVVGIVCMVLPMEMAMIFSVSIFGILIKMYSDFGDNGGI